MRRVFLALLILGVALQLPPPAEGDGIRERAGAAPNAGGVQSNADYQIHGTLGQTAAGVMGDEQLSNEGGFRSAHNYIQFCDWATHDVGNCLLSVTDQGSIGFTSDDQSTGLGFVYPKDGSNVLFIGSLWIGESATYVANREYSGDPDQEWVVSQDPDGHPWIHSDSYSEQDIHASFTDDGADSPRGLFVSQVSWAFASNPVMDDFVIVTYTVSNHSDTTLSDLYAGMFLDIDIDEYTLNSGSTDADRQMAYLTDLSEIHIGARLLQDAAGQPAATNVTLVHNPTYVWPNIYVPDADKYAFLSAADEEHILTDAPDPDDYSVLVSMGPFTLEPDENREIAFAIVGGSDLGTLRLHSDVAQQAYEDGPQNIPGDVGHGVTRMMMCAPNPSAASATIRFDLVQGGEVNLGIYDLNGRLVRTLIKGQRPAANYSILWDGNNQDGRTVPAGVYFLRLAAGRKHECARMIRIR